MRNKIVLWGTDAEDKRILVALELKIEENKVMLYTFPEALATDDFHQAMMDNWREDKEEVAFPEGHQSIVRELSIADSLLPEEIKVERTDLVQRAKTEWHFVVLSHKLNQAYQSELSDLEETLSSLKDYDKKVWENLKAFWGKVQGQISDRTLLREHADDLRKRTNQAFDQMKGLRTKMDQEFKQVSSANMERFNETLAAVEQRISDNKHLNRVFEDLKKIQKEIRGVSFTRDHRNKLWERVDKAFKVVKEKRFGEKSSGDNSPVGRLENRYKGLLNALEKMERSIKRDEDELAFQERRINRTDGQLEAQIRQAKIQVIEQRVSSKREKYKEMMATKTQLEGRIEKERERQAKREERAKAEAARKEAQAKAKEKIAEDIKRKQDDPEVDSSALENAAQAINEQKGKPAAKPEEPAVAAEARPTEEDVAPETPLADEPVAEAAPAEEASEPEGEDTLLGAIGTTLSESLEDVVDTAKAVGMVVGQKLNEAVEDIKEDIAEVTGVEKAEEEE